MRYLARRLLHAAGLLIGVSVLAFLFSELAPGDYLSDRVVSGDLSAERAAELRAEYGLDRSVVTRYGHWLRSVAKGEMGYSLSHRRSVAGVVWPRIVPTLLLTGVALTMAWIAALALGVASAARRGGLLDRAVSAFASTLLALPRLLLALAALLLAAGSGWFPGGGMVSLDHDSLGALGRGADLVRHLLLPASALALGSLGVLLIHVRSAMADVLDAAFLSSAVGRGVPPRRVLWGHALRAGANPLVSLFGLSWGGLLSGSLVVEIIFSWPGLGPLLLAAIQAQDEHLVIGTVLLSSVGLIAANLLADGLLVLVDPRVRSA